MITQQRLKELFNYDPETGLFTRLVRTGQRGKIGEIIRCVNDQGYIVCTIDSKNYRVHRLAVLYMTGKFPENDVDHIDGIRHNNKWLNLRECDEILNLQNLKKSHTDNRTGLLGVYLNKQGSYTSEITTNKIKKFLGNFKTKEEAHQAYLTAKRQIHEFNTL